MIWRLFTRSNLRASRQVLSSYKKYSTEGPRYVAPPRGTNEVYDAALDYLQEYSQIKLKRAEEAKIALASTNVESDKKELENEIFKLLVDSKLYQPATKWQFENKQYDINEPVFLYLKHKKWQEEEMPKAERDATAMFVLPDVLPPGVKLEAKLNVIYGSEEAVVLGTKKDPATTIGEPQVIVDCLHKESRRYALVMVDLDHPAPEIKNYREKFQWAKCNLSINFASEGAVSDGDLLIKYIPPHPAQGTKFHRYTFVLLEQPEEISPIAMRQALETPGITVRSLIAKFGLVARGLHFFRAEWSPAVSAIYTETFGVLEPIFGPQPIVDPRIGPDGRYRNTYLNV